jgi:hypothetical protein
MEWFRDRMVGVGVRYENSLFSIVLSHAWQYDVLMCGQRALKGGR